MPLTTKDGLIFQNAPQCALGRVTQAGFSHTAGGIPESKMRILGSYAAVYSLGGLGRYKDQRGHEQRLLPGDFLLVFPDIGHSYGAQDGHRWHEFWIVFEGPMFDLWRKRRLFEPDAPVRHLEPVEYWLRRFEEIVEGRPPVDAKQSLAQICRLQQALADALLHDRRDPAAETDAAWLAEACAHLETHLERPMYFAQVAKQMSMSYETFRKRFVKLAGVSPGQYRMTRVMDRACELLHQGDRTNKEIALALGFCDEFHFSRRFKQVTGKSPTGFRGLWSR